MVNRCFKRHNHVPTLCHPILTTRFIQHDIQRVTPLVEHVTKLAVCKYKIYLTSYLVTSPEEGPKKGDGK